MAAPGGRGAPCTCRKCQLLQEMKRIPAKCITHGVRQKLSQVLDPVRDLPDRDYRSFADRSGIMPYVWQWLDSQKVLGETSSICKVLDHLIQQHGTRYTVFNVYQTLVDMGSEGQNVILQGMQDIRRMYGSGTRPGQEHAETSSLPFQSPCSLDDNRPVSPPPPYNSYYAADQGDSYPPNNLGAACQPQEQPDAVSFGAGRGGFPQDGRRVNGASWRKQGDWGRPEACEASFNLNTPSQMGSASEARMHGQRMTNQQPVGDSSRLEQGPVLQLGRNLGEPTEASYSFGLSPIHLRYDGRSALSSSPPSYTESQLQHNRMLMQNTPLSPSAMQHPELNLNLVSPAASSPTDMMELKPPLPEPVVEVEERMNNLSSPGCQTGLISWEEEIAQNQDHTTQQRRPAAYRQERTSAACQQGHITTHSLQGGGTHYSQHGWSTSDKQGGQGMNIAPGPPSVGQVVEGNRASYPKRRHLSYKSKNRHSDSSYISQSGAYSCLSAHNNDSFNPPSLDSPESHFQSAEQGDREPGETSQAVSGSYRPNIGSTPWRGNWSKNGSSVSCDGNLWNHALHQTEIKRPIETTSQGNGGMSQSGHLSMPQGAKTPPQCPQGPASMPPQVTGSPMRNMSEGRLPTKFIFILAADMEETCRLNEQVWKLSNQLAQEKMPHVALSSSSDQPIVRLSSSTKSQQPYLNGDVHTQRDFVKTCFNKATIVMMMVSPGYLRYADKYTEGARSAESDQQELIRGFHEDLKSEFFDLANTRLRVWPVLHLKANRMHLPSFLSEGTYYFYPREKGSENLFVLLKQLVFTKVKQNI